MLDVIFLLPETYAKTLLEKKAQRLRKETGNDKLRAASEINKPTIFQVFKVSLLRYGL
jgi:hypothetical protein